MKKNLLRVTASQNKKTDEHGQTILTIAELFYTIFLFYQPLQRYTNYR